MPENPATQLVAQRLFDRPGVTVYAVLDGASIPDLLAALHQHRPEHHCLYRGELAPDMAETAPYVVRLTAQTPFAEWLLGQGWGKHWGIFALSPADLRAMRRHLRTFLMVVSPENKPLYFRYYDPRVLRVYLPTCNDEEAQEVFGPVVAYALEGEDPAVMLRFTRQDGQVRQETVRLAGVADRVGRL